MDEPKLCPFCGDEPLHQSTGETWCGNPECLMNANVALDSPPYVETWNIRPTEETATATERARALAWLKEIMPGDNYSLENIAINRLRRAIESGEQPKQEDE